MSKKKNFIHRLTVWIPDELSDLFKGRKQSKAEIVRQALFLYHDLFFASGSVVEGKRSKRNIKTFKTILDIHKYAKTHVDFQEPQWIKLFFETPGELERLVVKVFLKD